MAKIVLPAGQYESVTEDITLSPISGKLYYIKNTDTSDITVTYGSNTQVLAEDEMMAVMYDGTEWARIEGMKGEKGDTGEQGEIGPAWDGETPLSELTVNGNITCDSITITGSSYGLRWNATTDSYTRLDSAVGLSVNNSSSPHVSSFSNVAPWSEIKRCNLGDDLNVNAFYGDVGYTEDGSNGEVLVQIPKFYYKVNFYTDGNGHKIREWYISNTNLSGYKVHPAFINAGVEKDYFYISAYEGYNDGGTLRSIAGVQPTTDQTIGTFRTQARVHGNGWGIQDFNGISAVQLLYLIEYGSLFSQDVLSEGITNLDSGTVNHSQNTGHTSSLGNASGETTILEANLENGATGDDTYPFSYRGIENLYGNIWVFTDGILVIDEGFLVGKDIDSYSDSGTGYQLYNTIPTTSDGYGKDFAELQALECALILNEVGGSSTTYITDYLYAHDVGETNVALFGARWNDGSTAGAFCWGVGSVASRVSRYVGARLLAK